ncbi:MAG TPA: hypothetical protein ACFE0H_13000 [Elainellaceae cyanobacterium]|jgi:hypothetical protein
MTQEEIITEIEQAFSADTGLMSIPTRLSELVDEYVEDDFEHWQMLQFFEWVWKLSKEQNHE